LKKKKGLSSFAPTQQRKMSNLRPTLEQIFKDCEKATGFAFEFEEFGEGAVSARARMPNIKKVMVVWKQLVKDGVMLIAPQSCFTLRVNGKEWFAINIVAKGDRTLDRVAEEFGINRVGCCFWFPLRENRDAVVHFVNGGKKRTQKEQAEASRANAIREREVAEARAEFWRQRERARAWAESGAESDTEEEEESETEEESKTEAESEEEEILITRGMLGKWGAKQECVVAYPLVEAESVVQATLLDEENLIRLLSEHFRRRGMSVQLNVVQD
jgi:flagellar biosynthesis GTPase FlhF